MTTKYINAKRHTEKLILAILIESVVKGGTKLADEYEISFKEYIDGILDAEINPKKRKQVAVRSWRCVRALMLPLVGESGEKTTMAVTILLNNLAELGFEMFEPEETPVAILAALLEKTNPDTDWYEKRLSNAHKLADKWLEQLNKEGYFV